LSGDAGDQCFTAIHIRVTRCRIVAQAKASHCITPMMRCGNFTLRS
jgi:hypothetical protein